MKFLVFIAVWMGVVANAQAREIEFLPSSDPEVLRILADTLDYKDIGDALIAWEDVNSDGEKELFFYDETRKCVEHLYTVSSGIVDRIIGNNPNIFKATVGRRFKKESKQCLSPL